MNSVTSNNSFSHKVNESVITVVQWDNAWACYTKFVFEQYKSIYSFQWLDDQTQKILQKLQILCIGNGKIKLISVARFFQKKQILNMPNFAGSVGNNNGEVFNSVAKRFLLEETKLSTEGPIVGIYVSSAFFKIAKIAMVIPALSIELSKSSAKQILQSRSKFKNSDFEIKALVSHANNLLPSILETICCKNSEQITMNIRGTYCCKVELQRFFETP